MNRRYARRSNWPTPRQLLILRAITSEDAQAAAVWQELKPQLELERLELGSFELMPLLYRRLRDVAPADPVLGKLAGVYRKTWYTNQLELSRVTPALGALVEAQTKPLVVNGWEFVLAYNGDRGARSVAGLEVLIPPQRVSEAEKALAAAGWLPDVGRASRLPQRLSSKRFVREGTTCVVHRELFEDFPAAVGSLLPSLWESATPLTVDGVQAAMLGSADEFLNICLRGARARNWPNVRWLADALQVAGAADMDWQRVVQQARLLRATLRLRSALRQLSDWLSDPDLSDVLSELEAAPSNRRERLANALDARRGGALGLAPESLTRYLRATAGESTLHAAAGLASFLRDEWALRHRRHVPVVVVAKTGARIASTVARVMRPAAPDRHYR